MSGTFSIVWFLVNFVNGSSCCLSKKKIYAPSRICRSSYIRSIISTCFVSYPVQGVVVSEVKCSSHHRGSASLFSSLQKPTSLLQYKLYMHIRDTNFFSRKMYPTPIYCYITFLRWDHIVIRVDDVVRLECFG